MLFSELYGSYYQTVAKILKEAVRQPIDSSKMAKIIRENAFGESMLNIPYSLGKDRWQLLKDDATAIIKNEPTMPLTTLQKRWINAVSLDVRIHLFTDTPLYFADVEPLFRPQDIDVFDKYSDGDPYQDEEYIKHFRLVLDAIKNQYSLQITMVNRHGKVVTAKILPSHLEYSPKDDKFRVIGSSSALGNTINLGRITSCQKCESCKDVAISKPNKNQMCTMILELYDSRNALERVLLHFAHFEKQVERIKAKKYRMTLLYDKQDETEVLIRVLSFGPMVKVVSPDSFVNLIKERLIAQKNCGI